MNEERGCARRFARGRGALVVQEITAGLSSVAWPVDELGSICGRAWIKLRARVRCSLRAKIFRSRPIYCSPLRAPPPFVAVEMEPNSDPPSRKTKDVALGRKSKGPAASSAAAAAASSFVRGNGRGSGLAAALFRAAGGPSPSSLSGSGASKTASSMPSSMGGSPPFDASSSSPGGRGGFTGAPSSAGAFAFPPSPSPAWWDAAASGGSPTAWDPTRYISLSESLLSFSCRMQFN